MAKQKGFTFMWKVAVDIPFRTIRKDFGDHHYRNQVGTSTKEVCYYQKDLVIDTDPESIYNDVVFCLKHGISEQDVITYRDRGWIGFKTGSERYPLVIFYRSDLEQKIVHTTTIV